MHPCISIRGFVHPSVGPSVGLSVRQCIGRWYFCWKLGNMIKIWMIHVIYSKYTLYRGFFSAFFCQSVCQSVSQLVHPLVLSSFRWMVASLSACQTVEKMDPDIISIWYKSCGLWHQWIRFRWKILKWRQKKAKNFFGKWIFGEKFLNLGRKVKKIGLYSLSA